MRYFLFLAVLVFAITSHAQTQNIPSTPPAVFTYVQEMPEYKGNINKFISDSLRYPKAALDAGIQGRVYVKFIVNEDGSISDVQVLRGLGYGLDEEAIRIVKLMPKWQPGQQNGTPVKVYYSLPLTFKLQ